MFYFSLFKFNPTSSIVSLSQVSLSLSPGLDLPPGKAKSPDHLSVGLNDLLIYKISQIPLETQFSIKIY